MNRKEKADQKWVAEGEFNGGTLYKQCAGFVRSHNGWRCIPELKAPGQGSSQQREKEHCLARTP